MNTTTQSQLTAKKLAYFQQWYKETFVKAVKPLNELEEKGTYWIYYSEQKWIAFEELHDYALKKEVFIKVPKLEVCDNYRKDTYGWIVPDELVEQFKECKEVARVHSWLRTNAIKAVSKISCDRYRRLKDLSPEKQQMLIDLFADSDE